MEIHATMASCKHRRRVFKSVTFHALKRIYKNYLCSQKIACEIIEFNFFFVALDELYVPSHPVSNKALIKTNYRGEMCVK